MMNKLYHEGVIRRSGRYPWGSGENPYQRNKNFLTYIDDLKKQGLSEVEIAKALNMTTSELRAKKSLAKNEKRIADATQAWKLYEKGYSKVAIGERMGINESSVRALLNPSLKEKSLITTKTVEMLKKNVEEKGYIDVGVGIEKQLGISRTKLKTALSQLKDEGYTVHFIQVQQLGTGKNTTVMTLAKPNVTYSEVYRNRDKIRMINDYSEDGGRSFLGLEPINNISSKRVFIRYGDEGGSDKDGVIELRRGIDDISLGNVNYAQVRIGVDGTHYMKGMAVYGDIPKGYDIIYNTNKPKGTDPKKVFKEMKTDAEGNIDPDNPFGATVRQKHYVDKNGKRELSALNIIYEEGDWGNWSKTISSQMLSKQSPSLAKKQLGLYFDQKKEEFDEIVSLNNPAVKKRLLDAFADDCDAASIHLKAAALPRQSTHAILPILSMKENEIYAPNFRNGERVVLIRHPHGGIFEIPELIVNNKNKEANKIMPQAKDAVGINPKVASILSGADFDGDSVLVIPNNQGLIKRSSPLKQLKNFDPKIAYPGYEGMPKISSRSKELKMGDVSNLITDMTIKGANHDEIARAVKHSMVIIDAEKHNLNWRQSYIDNSIAKLKEKYQGSARSGASTLISRASSMKVVNNRKEIIDPDTGKKTYVYTGETMVNKAGKTIPRTISSTKMAEVDDAFKLSSGTTMETVYAEHANRLKSLANNSRKISINTKIPTSNPEAKKLYSNEVQSLVSQLNLATSNKPLERQAQIVANAIVKMKKDANPHIESDSLKKLKAQALAEARVRVGAKKQNIYIEDREWEAIQKGAISSNQLQQILNNADLDRVKQLATPRSSTELTPAKKAKIQAMINNGYTQAEIADALGVSTTTISKL